MGLTGWRGCLTSVPRDPSVCICPCWDCRCVLSCLPFKRDLLIYLCIYMHLCVCVCMCTCVHTCEGMEDKKDVRSASPLLPTCSSETGFLSEPGTQVFLDRLQASQPQQFSCFCFFWSWCLKYKQDAWMVAWLLGSKLWPLGLYNNCFNYWTISPAPVVFYLDAGVQTPVSMFVWWTFYWLSHVSRLFSVIL